MQVQVEPVEPRQAQLTIVVPAERVDRAILLVAQDAARRMHISGYRPGKVPLRVVTARVDQEELRKEALERLQEQVVREAVRQEKIEPWAPVDVEVLSNEPFTVRAVVPLEPLVELPDYAFLTAAPVPPAPVGDDDVDELIERWRQELATVQTVERPAQAGDTVSVTLAGTADGVDPIARPGVQLALDGDGAKAADLPPSVVESLVGSSAGDHRAFDVTYSEFWPETALQGRQVHFEADVEAVMARAAPPLDDAFAAHIDREIGTLAELRARVRESLAAQARAEARDKQVDALLEQLVVGAHVAYPPVALEQEVAGAFVELRKRIESQGVSWEHWLELQGRTAEQVWAELEPEAATSLRRRLVLQRFVQVEGIRVSSREVDDAVDRLRRPLGRTARRVLPPVDVLRRSAGSRMLTSRAVDRLLEIAAANAATEAGETQVGSETGDPDPPREGSAAGTTDPQPKKA